MKNKTPLLYQRTEYDCGPTALLNTLSFLYPRDVIPPDIVKYITLYSLDTFNEHGEACKEGTSQMAMRFLSNWLNQYAQVKKLPLSSTFINHEEVTISENSKIVCALQQGGAVVMRLWNGVGHYITLTGIEEDYILAFDPYYEEETHEYDDIEGIEVIKHRPFEANRRIHMDIFNGPSGSPYSLEDFDKREAVILFNDETQLSPEKTIEYFL